MATATNATLADLVERLKALPDEEQRYYAAAFIEQLDYDAKFDKLIESSPDALDRLAVRALDEHKAGRTRPLSDDDFALDDD